MRGAACPFYSGYLLVERLGPPRASASRRSVGLGRAGAAIALGKRKKTHNEVISQAEHDIQRAPSGER